MDSEKQPAGIFIPYEKLLERIEDKLDRIDSKLDQKVDTHTFEAFRLSYEERHRKLEDRLERLEAPNPSRLIEEFREAQEDITVLQEWRAGLKGAYIFGLFVVGLISPLIVLAGQKLIN